MSKESSKFPAWVDNISSASPLDISSIENFTGAKLIRVQDNDGYAIYSGGPSDKDGLHMDEVTFKNFKDNVASPGYILSIKISGKCFSRSDILKHYSDAEITDTPRGKSTAEELVYSVSKEWGTLSFGFAQSNAECLSSVIFRKS